MNRLSLNIESSSFAVLKIQIQNSKVIAAYIRKHLLSSSGYGGLELTRDAAQKSDTGKLSFSFAARYQLLFYAFVLG